jgi:hypothetical protein
MLPLAALAAAFAAVPLSGALADREPDPREAAIIADVLLANGFDSWGRIEWDDDGVWEVDEAVGPDGRRHDVTLDAAFYIMEVDD